MSDKVPHRTTRGFSVGVFVGPALTAWLVALPALAAGPPTDAFADLPPPPLSELPAVEQPNEDSRTQAAAPDRLAEAARPDPAPPVAAKADPQIRADARTEPKKPTRTQPQSEAGGEWIEHPIVRGDRIDALAQRYGVTRAQLVRWNELDPKRPRIYAGRSLRVGRIAAEPDAPVSPPATPPTVHVVERGDTWYGLARRYGVDQDRLRRWNPDVPSNFPVGTRLQLWLDDPDGEGEASPGEHPTEKTAAAAATGRPELELPDAEATPDPSEVEEDRSDDDRRSDKRGAKSRAKPHAKPRAKSKSTSRDTPRAVAVPTVRGNALSVGKPNRGRLLRAVALPEAPELYLLRRPDEAYASSHTARHLLDAIATFHGRSTYGRPLSIGSISRREGGKLRPHASHQSGRDVDIRLPLADPRAKSDHIPRRAEEVDWAAAWQLVRALIETGEVEYIFLDQHRQPHLRSAALADGARPQDLEAWIQHPAPPGTNNGLVRHAPGHGAHIHVRFKCGARELRCDTY